ncbi:MAG: hypothetical protein JNJ54_12325 [Myxococcaceae bacterium]|nr:hypothetical protein [Myxococcaceae bacterium]
MLTTVLTLVLAGSNAPEKGLARTKEEVLVKLAARCGARLEVSWDFASLKAHNQDIAWDQTDGELECNEPLRYLWALCATDAGRAVVRRSEVRAVTCQGTANAVGSLTFKAGVVTVERSDEERDSFLRARKQFEAAFKTTLTLEADPYRDEAWRDWRREPNPVTSTTDYCLHDGKKVAFDWALADRAMNNRGADTVLVKCFEAGKVVIDVSMKERKKTGLVTQVRDDWRRRVTLVADEQDGLEEEFDKGQLRAQTLWKRGDRVWSKELHPSGALKRYWRQYPTPLQVSVELREDGAVTGLACAAEAKDDEVLRAWCGFAGKKTVQVLDGTGKVNRTVTHVNGLLTRSEAGSSEYASRSTLDYVDGKPDGEERIVRRDGTLERTTMWARGLKAGPERKYGPDGRKVIEEASWRGGELERRVEFFLNGNKKVEEVLDGPKQKVVTEFFDLGGVRRRGAYVACARRFSRNEWCEDGVHTTFFESGKKAAEDGFREGRRVSAKAWYESGVAAEEETFVDGRLATRRQWFADGGVSMDEAYEADGSRVLRR